MVADAQMTAHAALTPETPPLCCRIRQGCGKGQRQQILVRHILTNQCRQIAGNQPGIKCRITAGGTHHRMPQQRCKKIDIGDGANEMGGIQTRRQCIQRRRPIRRMGNHLRNHRVIKRGHDIAIFNTAIDPHAGAGHKTIHRPGRRHEIMARIFRIEPCLNRVAIHTDGILHQGQRGTGGDAQLPFDEVDAGNGFGNGMLYLQTGVHFHEPETIFAQPVVAIRDKFDRAGTLIANGLCRGYGCRTHCMAHRVSHARRGRFFNHLLVAALHGAVAFKQMHHIPMAVGKNLNLDMARRGNVFFNQHMPIAKTAGAFAHGTFKGRCKIICMFDKTHAFATPARTRLDQNRIANISGGRRQPFRVLISAVIARDHRHTCLFHQCLCGILQPHGAHGIGRRANEDHIGCLYRGRECRVFRKKPVSGMDGICAGGARRRDNGINIQIVAATAKRQRDIGHTHMPCSTIGIAMDRNGFDAKTTCCFNDSAGNFPAIGNQDS